MKYFGRTTWTLRGVFEVFGKVVNHGVSCLMYYVKQTEHDGL